MEVKEACLQVLLAYISTGAANELFAHGSMTNENTIESIWPRIVKTLSATQSPSPAGESAKQ
jgi:hypothetical protein